MCALCMFDLAVFPLDPLKDTSGPALNIVMKLMAIISLVFANYFYSINEGRGVFKIPLN
jgi:hypothetical protein